MALVVEMFVSFLPEKRFCCLLDFSVVELHFEFQKYWICLINLDDIFWQEARPNQSHYSFRSGDCLCSRQYIPNVMSQHVLEQRF